MCKGNYVFQPGDVVRRKATELSSYWSTYMKDLDYNPTGDFIVVEGGLKSIVLKDDLGTWGSECFDLVRRATEPAIEPPTHKVQGVVSVTIAAVDILEGAADAMLDRAASRDTPEGERSMGRCVKAFNAMFGTELTETQGWQFMELLKMARSAGGGFRLDDFTDGVAYAALAGECEARLKQSV